MKLNDILKEDKSTNEKLGKLEEISVIDSPNSITFNPPYSKKSYLQTIQERFSWKMLEAKSNGNFKGKIYLYANDMNEIKDYKDRLEQILLDDENLEITNNFFQKENNFFPKKINKIAMIAGNGYIISLLPNIPANDVILLDIEPVVHYFLLYVKNLILETNENSFENIKAELITKIENFKYERNKEFVGSKNLQIEMKCLGDKHFLASEYRFNQVKKALKEKDLLPININIFDAKQMSELSKLIKKENLAVSLLNLSNLPDYDSDHKLLKSLDKLPLSPDCNIIFTKLIGYLFQREKYPNCCFILNDLKTFKQKLQYSYNGITSNSAYDYKP